MFHRIFSLVSYILTILVIDYIGAFSISQFSNFFVEFILTVLFSGFLIVSIIYLGSKFGVTNCLLFKFGNKTYYIRPWKFYMKAYRKNFPRKVLSSDEFTDEMIEEIKNSKMDEKHSHLNKYYDDTH